MVRTPQLLMLRAWVQSLVGELRSYKLQDAAKKKEEIVNLLSLPTSARFMSFMRREAKYVVAEY